MKTWHGRGVQERAALGGWVTVSVVPTALGGTVTVLVVSTALDGRMTVSLTPTAWVDG